MFGRRNVVMVASDALDGVSPYVDRLANDEQLRRRIGAAIAAGAAARTRARKRKQAGLVGLAMQLANDRVLRDQLTEATAQLRKANVRLKKHHSHKLRNAVLFVAGVGAVVAAVPSLRETVMGKLDGAPDDYMPPVAKPANSDMPDA
jgi:hypothetical protein